MVDGLVSNEENIPTPAISRREESVTIEEKQESAVPARNAETATIDGGQIARIMGKKTAERVPKGEVAETEEYLFFVDIINFFLLNRQTRWRFGS